MTLSPSPFEASCVGSSPKVTLQLKYWLQPSMGSPLSCRTVLPCVLCRSNWQHDLCAMGLVSLSGQGLALGPLLWVERKIASRRCGSAGAERCPRLAHSPISEGWRVDLLVAFGSVRSGEFQQWPTRPLKGLFCNIVRTGRAEENAWWLHMEGFSQQGCGFQTHLLTWWQSTFTCWLMGFLPGRVQNHRTRLLSPVHCLSSPVWPNSRFIPAFIPVCILILTL